MIKFLFLLLISLSTLCQGEQPLTICSRLHPFKTKENSCASFNEICVKRGDEECDNLQNACAQCPSSNRTILILQEMLQMKGNLTSINSDIKNLQGNLTSINSDIKNLQESVKSFQKQLSESRTSSKSFGIVLIFFLCILLIVFLLVLIWRYIFYRKKNKKKDESTERLLEQSSKIESQTEIKKSMLEQSSKIEYQTEIMKSMLEQSSKIEYQTEIMKSLLEQSSKIEYQTDIMKSLLEQSSKIEYQTEIMKNILKQLSKKESAKELIKDNSNPKIKFHINGTNTTIDLCVHEDDTVVKIKKQLCSRWAEAKPHYIKIMKLSCNGRTIDDNQYLLSEGTSKFSTITCDLDHSINHGSIVILKIHGNQNLPEFVQVRNYEMISDLKEIFAKFYKFKSSSLEILKDVNKYEILNDKSTIKECSLMDEDWIKVIKKEKGKITIRSIFEENESFVVEYSNTEQVSSLKKSVANKFQSNPDNFVLFFNNQHLPEDKYIFDLNIKNENALRFCFLMSLKTLEYDPLNPFDIGYFSDLFEAKDKITERELILKRYKKLRSSNLKVNRIFANELVTCLITKSHPRFIQIYNVFKEGEFLYIAEERMAGGSIRNYSKDNRLSEKEVVTFSKQILEGLHYLHSNGIIFGDLKASNILLDTNKNLKLPSFSLSKYVYEDNSVISSGEIPFRYVAPEVSRKEKYDSKADVWSFGMILIELVSGDKPLHNLKDNEAKDSILKGKTIEFKMREGIRENIKSFINSCIKQDPKERSSIEKLIQEKF